MSIEACRLCSRIVNRLAFCRPASVRNPALSEWPENNTPAQAGFRTAAFTISATPGALIGPAVSRPCGVSFRKTGPYSVPVLADQARQWRTGSSRRPSGMATLCPCPLGQSSMLAPAPASCACHQTQANRNRHQRGAAKGTGHANRARPRYERRSSPSIVCSISRSASPSAGRFLAAALSVAPDNARAT